MIDSPQIAPLLVSPRLTNSDVPDEKVLQLTRDLRVNIWSCQSNLKVDLDLTIADESDLHPTPHVSQTRHSGNLSRDTKPPVP